MPKIRFWFYNLTITGFTNLGVLKDIVKKILDEKDITDDDKLKIIEKASYYEKKFNACRRKIFHVDGFIASVIHILYLSKNKN
jgi:hypothetical protein